MIVDRLMLWKGSRLRPVRLGEVEDQIKQAVRSYNGAELVADPWNALQMLERLRGEGVRASEFTFSQAGIGRLAMTMVNLLRDRRLALPDDAELLEELRAVRLIERSPGNFRIDHAPGQHDDQTIAIALAAQHLLREEQTGPVASGPVVWGNEGDGVPAGRWHPGHVPDGHPRRRDHVETWAQLAPQLRKHCPECEAEWARAEARANESPPVYTIRIPARKE